MTADIRLAVSVIRTVFAQNHRAAATAADDHANTPNNTKTPLPQHQLREGQLRMDLTSVKLDAKLCQVSQPNRWQ